MSVRITYPGGRIETRDAGRTGTFTVNATAVGPGDVDLGDITISGPGDLKMGLDKFLR